MRFSLILSITTLLASTLVTPSDAQQQQACNGYSGLCAKTYDKVSYPTTHNAYAYVPPGGVATNQNNDILTQLKDGIRAFMLDAHEMPTGGTNDIELCHGACKLLDSGPLSKTLGQIKTFMDANPNEVITILWENTANLAPARFQTVYAAAGMVPYSYVPSKGANAAWPTLAKMISSGKRLVSFIDQGADASVPWLMAEYDFVFETPWMIEKGAAYPCTVDRPKDQRKPMYVLNHFVSGVFGSVSIPQPGAAAQTNGPDLTSHINSCQSTFNQAPNFVAVDFYEKGDLLEAVAKVNGEKWNGQVATQNARKGSGSGSGSGSDSGSGSRSGSGGGNSAVAGAVHWSIQTLGLVSAAVVGGMGLMAL